MPDAVGTIHTITDLSNNKYNIHGVLYGVCETEASVLTKAVTIPGITGLTEGLSIRVKFVNGLSVFGAPSLNLNNLGAISIRRKSSENANAREWSAGEVIDLVYDGTYWIIVNGEHASLSSYGSTLLVDSATLNADSGSVAPSVITNLAQYMISGAPVYSESDTYSVGDRVRYGFKTYECITDIASPETWNASKWRALDSLQTQIDNMGGGGAVCIEGETTTLSVGTTTVSLSGLTSSHIVCDWGFSVGDQNNPPANIEVVTSDGSYTITVATLYTSGATMTPIFIKPYNV